MVRDLLTHHGAADLVTPTSEGLVATLLPMLYDENAGENGALLGHVARNNDHWRLPATGESLAIVRGSDTYVTPSWYQSKREHGRVVPTLNYVTAHVYGELVVHDDVDWLESLVRALTEKHETSRAEPWTVDDAPEKFVAGQLRAIVGLELRISRVEAKLELGQNRPRADIEGVVDGLTVQGEHAAVRAMRELG